MKKNLGPNFRVVQSHGANSNAENTIPRWLVPAAIFFGIGFLVAILVLVVQIPSPTPSQFVVFRIVIALAGAAFSMAFTGFLSVQMHWNNGLRIAAGGSSAVFLILLFFTPSIPVVTKPEPLIDSRGHILESPANESELDVIRLQDQIADLRQYKESIQQPDSRRALKDAPSLAERILSFSDSNLNPRRRFIKYEFAAFAFVDAAAAAMFDDHQRVENYAPRAIENAVAALSMLDAAESSYSSDKNSRFLLDWIPKHEGKDRVLYLRADAECMLATIRNDKTLKATAAQSWNLISPEYRRALPAKGTLQLSNCVPPEKED